MDAESSGLSSSDGGEMERLTEAAALVRLRSRHVFRRVVALVEATAIGLSPTGYEEKTG